MPRRARLYLPLDELDRFGLDPDEFVRRAAEGGAAPFEWASLLGFQLERAREHYARARAALPAVDRRSLASAEIMGAIYRVTLETLAARRFRLTPRARISGPRRAWIALATLARVRLP